MDCGLEVEPLSIEGSEALPEDEGILENICGENVNRTCSSGLDLHYKVVDLGVTSKFVVEVEG